MESIPDWQLPPGVDRGLWDYLHSGEMVAGYDEQMTASPVARADVSFCEKWFAAPGRLLDMGCGTGRLCRHFAAKGYECVGVDLSEEMLAKAHESGGRVEYRQANLVDLHELPDASFDYAACLFSTLGMIRGDDNRKKVLANAHRLLNSGGRFVLHVHNRYFLGLGWRNWSRGEITMPQAYGGAELTLRHFSLRGIEKVLQEVGFQPTDIRALDIHGNIAGVPVALRSYGYLLSCAKTEPRALS